MSDSVVFTTIFGGYDTLKDPIVYDKDMSYICFTDDPGLVSDVWEIRVVEPEIPDDSSKSSRFIKINAHKFLDDFKYSLYVDGTMILKSKFLVPFILNGYKIAVETHPWRDCIYEEAKECIRLHKVEPKIVNEQIEIYRQYKFPKHAGLYANWMIAREHNDSVLAERCEEWWDHVLHYSTRDQISFPLVFKDYTIGTIPIGLRKSLVDSKPHVKR